MKLNRFIKNSDYTAEKQKLDFKLTIPWGSVDVGAGGANSRSVDFTVPAGVYFESVTITTNWTGDRKYVGNFLEFEPYDMMAVATFTVAQVNNTTYRLTGRLQNWADYARTFWFNADAEVHLSIAPF